TLTGMAMRAISYDRSVVPLMGISVDRIISLTFAIGSGLAAVGGILFGQAYPVIDPYMGILVGWKAFVAAVVGGIGNIRGAMLGAYILGMTEIYVAAFLPSTYRDFVAFSLLLLLLVFRPTGILGRITAQKVLGENTYVGVPIGIESRRAPGWAGRLWAPALAVLGYVFVLTAPRYGLINPYIEYVLMLIGINIILTVSLNLVNGFMGEFAVGHAGFMAVGAYVSSILSVRVFPAAWGVYGFPLALVGGGIGAGIVALLVAFPSFRTRGDYLAIVTLALNMIVKSVIENIEAIGGPRGFFGMERFTNLPWVYVVTLLTLWTIRNFVFSNY